VKRQSHLLEVVDALGSTSSITRRLYCGEQQSDQYADDRDDDQQFDEREPGAWLRPTRPPPCVWLRDHIGIPKVKAAERTPEKLAEHAEPRSDCLYNALTKVKTFFKAAASPRGRATGGRMRTGLWCRRAEDRATRSPEPGEARILCATWPARSVSRNPRLGYRKDRKGCSVELMAQKRITARKPIRFCADPICEVKRLQVNEQLLEGKVQGWDRSGNQRRF
jgi:hypothetical protein